MFVDDTNVFIPSKSLIELVNKLNTELQKVKTWLKANKRSLSLVITICRPILFCFKEMKWSKT